MYIYTYIYIYTHTHIWIDYSGEHWDERQGLEQLAPERHVWDALL